MKRLASLLLVFFLALPSVAQAARTSVTPVVPSRAGNLWSWTATDTVNGNRCTWGSVTLLFAQNTTAGALSITLVGAQPSDTDLTAPNRVISLAASSSGVIIIGQYYQQADGSFWFDAPVGVNFACMIKP